MHQTSRKTPIVLLVVYVVVQFLHLEMRWLLNKVLGPKSFSEKTPKRVV